MGWLTAFQHAKTLRDTLVQKRRELQGPPPAGMCRRCGCDTQSCRDWGCLTQGEPMSEDRLRGHGDADACRTNYEHRRYG